MRWFEYSAFLVTVVLLARPISLYLMRVFGGQKTFLDPVCRPVEAQLYRWLGVDPKREMTAAEYFLCFLAFSMVGTAFLFLILIFQRWLPGGPDAELPHDAHDARPGGQHRGQLLDDHHLAGLRRRIDPAVSAPRSSAWRRRTSSPGRPGWRSAWPSFAGSPATARRRSATSGSTWSVRCSGC